MNYLNICQITSSKENNCYGIVMPKTYSNWAETNPDILLFEGIHQFCVKAVKSVFPFMVRIQIVPVQLKDIWIAKDTNYDEFDITGNVISCDDMVAAVEFVATKKNKLIGNGTVIVSRLEKDI